MLKNWLKIVLFISSYIPLFAIIGVQNYDKTNLVIALSILSVSVLIILWLEFRRIESFSGKYRKIDSVENVNKISLEYFVVYIIPFLTVNFLKVTDVISMLIIFGVMAIMYIKSDLIYMNPMLNLRGYNLYKIISEGDEYMIITKKKRKELLATEKVMDLADHVLLGNNSERPITNGGIS